MKSSSWVLSLLIIVDFSVINGLRVGDSNRKGRDISGFVIKGKILAREKFPWLAALFLKAEHQFRGAGSLISSRFVITAAHCLQGKGDSEPLKPENMIVYFGIFNLSEVQNENVVKVVPEEYFIHFGWNYSEMRYNDDIAIIKFASAIQFSQLIQPIKIRLKALIIPAENKDVGIVAGW